MKTFYSYKNALASKRIWFSLIVFLAFSLVAILAPVLAPHDPYRSGFTQSNLPPMWVDNPYIPGQAEYPLGTDRFGRDVLSRLLFGTRTAFFLAFSAVPLAAIVGTLAGLMAGYADSRLDAAIQWLTEIVQCIPGIMFMVMVVLLLRESLKPTWFHGLLTLIVGFAAVNWVSLARLVRANVQILRQRLFVEAAVSLGASRAAIIWRHLLPNVLPVILVWIINNIPAVILLEAILGYIGVGITSAVDGGEFTVVSWGGLFFSGRSAMSRNPLILIIPSLCILFLSMSFILLGDFLNDNSAHHGS
jgi:peptide/nickel transport system permease protein